MLSQHRLFPKLNTHSVGGLHYLEDLCLKRKDDIETWFLREWKQTHAPFYGSVDLRNAGFKLAPIDMNLFPAGFNNLDESVSCRMPHLAREAIFAWKKDAKKVLLIPENHTRNRPYWDSVLRLKSILMESFDVELGVLPVAENEFKPMEVALADGNSFSVQPVSRTGNRLKVNAFDPDVILLNNDLSSGVPSLLENLEQLILPPVELGWSTRLKSQHFSHYETIAKSFSDHFSLDAWLIDSYFDFSDDLDFMQQSGMDELHERTHVILQRIQKKYDQYSISHKPFVIVKADAGTYGMAVMTIRDASELTQLNRKQRTRMSSLKGGQMVRRVIIQEGVYTFEVIEPQNSVCEPVVYLMGERVLGGFYRVHEERGIDENLNAPGMHFQPLAFRKRCDEPDHALQVDADCNRFYTYGVVARLSMLAAAREIHSVRS